MLRKLLIVVLLFWAMAELGSFSGLHDLADDAPLAMVSFGFIILAAYTLGAVAEKLKLPHITGYLLAGVACGPHLLGLLNARVVAELKVFDALAIALIAMEAGASLDLAALRTQLRQILTSSLALAMVALAAGLVFAGITSGVVPAVALPFLEGQPLGLVLGVGLLLGVVFLAASPPVTMAVIRDANARGPFTNLILTLVIFVDIVVVVLLASVLALIPTLVGAQAVGGPTGASLVLQEFAWSAALGLVAAVATAGALRTLGGDALLAIVGLAFVITWIGEQVHASPLLTFLAAGVLLNNGSKQGEAFHAVAHRLASPVFVLFFTLLGADLHLDAVKGLVGFAVAMVLLRLGGYATALRLASALAPLPDKARSIGFLGMAPQAGIALAVAATVGRQYPGWGVEFQTLAFSAIALNEMVGPILLKASLSMAGEAGAATPKAAEAEAPDPETEAQAEVEPPPMPRLSEWLPEPGRPDFDPWGGPPRTGDRRLDELCRELQRDLDAMVRDLRAGVIARRRETAHGFVQLLRKEFLRSHRHCVVKAADPHLSHEQLWAALAAERGDLASRWKGLLLDRAASVDFRAERQAITALLEGVDRASQALPTALTGPLSDEHLAPSPEDSRPIALRKAWLRLRRSTSRIVGDEPLRVVEPRAIARYVFVGTTPLYLRDAVGLLVLEERYLLARARNLFEALDHTMDEVIQLARQERDGHAGGEADDLGAADPDTSEFATARRAELLSRLREELEEEFRLLSEGIDRFSDEAVRVTASALGRAYRDLAQRLAIAGTPALVPGDYRFSRVFEASGKATAAILEGLEHARQHTRGNAAALAMELDVVRLIELVRRDTERVATETGRDVRGRMTLQLGRVQEAMDEALAGLGELQRQPPRDPGLLLDGVDELLAPLARVVDEVVGIAQQYRGAVRAQPPFEQLMIGLTSSVDGLTDRFQVVFDPSGPTGRGIPAPPAVVDVAFRDLVRAFIESETGRELSTLATRLQEQVDGFARGIEEIDRMLVFHAELARAELEAREEDASPAVGRDLLEESLASVLRRLARRAQELQEATDQLAAEVEQGVLRAVLGNLQRLREVLVTGQVQEIRARLAQRTFAQGRRELASAATRAVGVAGHAVRLVRATLGEDALHEARKIMGLPDADRARSPGPDAFAPPSDRVDIPIAYRRLFSDRALEAGDMLVGREDEVARLRQVLLGRGLGASRAVAVVGVGGMGQGAVMQALVRGLGDRARVQRFDLEAPGMDARVVDEMLGLARQAAGQGRPTIITVDGFQWLFDIRPRGFDLLRHFVAGVVETSAEVGWLVSADRPVWAYANRAVPLGDAFPERIDIDLLDSEGLRRAILSRHAMSGYKLQFRRPEDNLAWWLREALNPRARELALYERHYFEALHHDCGGVLRDALRLWMASITTIDPSADTVWISSPPAPPIRALRELPDDVAIALRQVARSGRITAENHALQFQVPVAMSRALLARLTHWGLLQAHEDDSYTFRDEVAGAIYRVLRERRLVG
ncbi:cation:proton antiporter [Myxococcota bacterium]|nr:cation:proton antiporter [Myxococcota bacterium]